MSIAATLCRGQLGLQAPPVQVQVNLGAGLPVFNIVGLAAQAVKESKDRVRAALTNCGFEFPAGRITVSLAPADLPKEGGQFDLPIAMGILLASGQVIAHTTPERMAGTTPGRAARSTAKRMAGAAPERAGGTDAAREFYGELSLDGDLLPVRGLVLAAAHAAQDGHEIIVPEANVAEALMAQHPRVFGARTLLEVCEHLRGHSMLRRRSWQQPSAPRGQLMGSGAAEEAEEHDAGPAGGRPGFGAPARDSAAPDLADVHGQLLPKRAVLIAAAGAHSLLLCGPPGSGKSMLAHRLPGLLPPLSAAEALEVATIAAVSAAGLDPQCFGVRPFRAPHHTASAAALIGGGPRARPGEVSLAHRGVLFLDELPEFDRRVLETLREPLESGVVMVSRARIQARYPALFQLVAAMNPCACGYLGDADGNCRCTPAQVQGYRAKLSGPLLDRIDLFVDVPRVPLADLAASYAAGEDAGAPAAGGAGPAGHCELTTAAAARQVAAARARQLARCGRLNSQLGQRDLTSTARLAPAARRLLERAFAQLCLTARSWHRLLRVARTIADLEHSSGIEPQHLAEAVQLRRLDRRPGPQTY